MKTLSPWSPTETTCVRSGQGGEQWGSEEENGRYKRSQDRRWGWTAADEGWGRRDGCGDCDWRLGFIWGLHATAETTTTGRTTCKDRVAHTHEWLTQTIGRKNEPTSHG